MPKLTIDGIEVEAEPGMTILQAADLVGIEIPRFCYHERLSVAGNCRMCLVEVKPGPPKPAASCAMPVAEGMQVWTQSDLAVKARKGVMEFLLINHPLDCPICDQGGECDLQDQAMAFGGDRSRYHEHKRAVAEKYMGPLVKTAMTRCIHCTRCVRFITEIAGIPELGMVGRGEHAEITSYVEKALSSELSGNIVDLCPVGALTSAPYAFHARPWELRKVESIDVFDAVGSNIRVDVRGNAVMRVLPRLHEDINEEWLADKSRHAPVDGLRAQRLDQPYIREDGALRPASWEEALRAVAGRLLAADADKVAALAGDMADAEAMMVLKDLMGVIGSPHMDCRQDGAALDPADRAGYLFNPTIAGIEDADAVLIVGSDPRWEAPILNARIRKRYLMGNVPIAVVGPRTDLTYQVEDLGNDPEVLDNLARGRHPFWRVLDDAERPLILVGMGALARPDGADVMASVRHLAERVGAFKDDWNGLGVLHTAAARVGGLELGFVPGKRGRDTAAILDGASKGDIDVVYLLGADEIDTTHLGEAFVIYQGHHGDAGANRADVILPGAAYTEKNATYVNTEGRMQRTWLAVHAPGEAREDWKILRALSSAMGKPLPQNTLEDVRARLAEVSPTFAPGNEGAIVPAPRVRGASGGGGGRLERTPFASPVKTYYMTDPISRASRTMAACTDVYINGAGNGDSKRTGTDG